MPRHDSDCIDELTWLLNQKMSVIKTQGKVISAILILFFYYFSNIRIRFHYDAEPITENIEIHEIMKTPAVYISSQLAWFSNSTGKLRAIIASVLLYHLDLLPMFVDDGRSAELCPR